MKKQNVSVSTNTPDAGRVQSSSCSEITDPTAERFRVIREALLDAWNEEQINPINVASLASFKRLGSLLTELLRIATVLADEVDTQSKVKAVMKSMPCDIDGMLKVLIEELTARRIDPNAGRSDEALRETIKLMVDIEKLKVAQIGVGIMPGRSIETAESPSKESRE